MAIAPRCLWASFSPHLSIVQRPTSPCLNKHTVWTAAEKMVRRWKMKWKHTWLPGGVSRLIGWHWQKPGAAWFPVFWPCALSMDFGLCCDSLSYRLHILQILSAKELKHRQINKLADAGGGNVFCGFFVFFFSLHFRSISHTCLWIQKGGGRGIFLMSFGCHQEGNTEWFFEEELVTAVFRNRNGVKLIPWYEFLQHF